jgi:probable HAF family extracellular repeat protein
MTIRIWLTLAWILAICAPTPSFAVGLYFVTEVGTLPGGATSVSAADINSRGQVVGQNQLGPGPNSRGFLWSPTTPNGTSGSMVPLSPRAAGALGINDYGQVVGSVSGFSGIYLWTPDTPNATSGSIVEFNRDPTADLRFVTAINSVGQFVGFDRDNSSLVDREFLWTPTTPNGSNGTMVEIGDLPGGIESNLPHDINEFGQIAGWSAIAAISGQTHAYLWTPNMPNGPAGSMVDLGDFPGGPDQSGATGINARGQVVGYGYVPTGDRAFLWTPNEPNGSSGSMVDLGELPGGIDRSNAYDINSQGQVVGESWRDGPRAFLWTPTTPNGTTGVMVDLNRVVDPVSGAGWTLRYARAINDAGQIVGSGLYDPDGPGGATEVERAFLLTPVPEPSALTVSTIGVLLLNCAIRRAKRLNDHAAPCR